MWEIRANKLLPKALKVAQSPKITQSGHTATNSLTQSYVGEYTLYDF